MPTKIETELPPAEVAIMCEKLFRTDGGRMLHIIQAEARKYGVEISKPSAAAFRDNVLDPYIAGLKAKSERAQQVAAFAQEGLSLSDAAAVRLSETVFDELMAPTAESLTSKERDTYSKIISRARAGDQRAKKLELDLKLATARIQEMEARRAAEKTQLRARIDELQKAIAANAGSPESRQRMMQAIVETIDAM